jgi:VanZ family protein
MQWLMRIVCIGYVVFLTLLLLTSDPSRWIGAQGGLPRILEVMLPIAHAISFLVLAVLALMTRWPIPRWSIVLILAVYAGMTEIIQGRVPHRTPEWADWVQDLVGIALGAACCWGVARLVAAFVAARRSREHPPASAPDEWTVIRRLLQRSSLDERSWWK